MAIIVNGVAHRTLRSPVYYNGEQIKEAYYNGVKCYPDELPDYPYVLKIAGKMKLTFDAIKVRDVAPGGAFFTAYKVGENSGWIISASPQIVVSNKSNYVISNIETYSETNTMESTIIATYISEEPITVTEYDLSTDLALYKAFSDSYGSGEDVGIYNLGVNVVDTYYDPIHGVYTRSGIHLGEDNQFINKGKVPKFPDVHSKLVVTYKPSVTKRALVVYGSNTYKRPFWGRRGNDGYPITDYTTVRDDWYYKPKDLDCMANINNQHFFASYNKGIKALDEQFFRSVSMLGDYFILPTLSSTGNGAYVVGAQPYYISNTGFVHVGYDVPVYYTSFDTVLYSNNPPDGEGDPTEDAPDEIRVFNPNETF